MDEKPKIQFADEPTKPAIGWIHGLPLTVSPGAADVLAGVHLAFPLMQQFTGAAPVSGPQQMIMPGEPEGDEDPDTLDLRYLNSLSPLARAESLAMYGLKQAGEEPREADPTALNVAKILEEAEKAERRKYEPSDDGG